MTSTDDDHKGTITAARIALVSAVAAATIGLVGTTILGMTLMGKDHKSPSGVAPAYTLDNALKLMTPKVSQGAHMIPLQVPKFSAVAATPQRDYQKIDLAAWAKNPKDNQAYEMVVALAGTSNISGAPVDPKEHAGTKLYDNDGGVWVLGVFKKGSAVQRVVEPGSMHYQGNGKPDRLYVVKGYSMDLKSGLPRAGFMIESIEEVSVAATVSALLAVT